MAHSTPDLASAEHPGGLAAVPRSLSVGRRAVVDQTITAMAGPSASLRLDQETAIAALTESGARALVVQATGWGKSAVYWAATAVRRAEGSGPTLVVSPLLSLMRDQVAAAQRAGLRAATINSGNLEEWAQIEADLLAGNLDVLLVSPERLANPGFGRRVLDALTGKLGLLVIDEAHAVSDWGHDFRPDYRRVCDVLRRLNPQTPVLATTATANERVTADVAAQLGDATLVLRGPLARASLELAIVDDLTPLQRYAWVVDHLAKLPGSGIVYALTVSDANRLAEAIRAVHGDGVPVAAYTGQLEAGSRAELEDALLANRLKALIATSALGMGYDKPDLGFVVHVGSPPSPVSYYQQVGRAGRAIEHAVAVLLSSSSDAGIWDYFATATIPVPEHVERVLAVLGPEPKSIPAIEAETGLRRTRVELMCKQLAVEEVTERVEGGWIGTGAPWVYDAERYRAIIEVREREADIMRAYTRGEACLMELLQRSLDDDEASRCGRCSVCTGHLPQGLTPSPELATVRAVARQLRKQTHRIEPRKMWPGGDFGARGRIPPHLMAAEGRALIFADAPEWREALVEMFMESKPVTEEVLQASVDALAQWRSHWARRPECVVPLPASGHAQVVSAVAQHLSKVGRLEMLELEAPRVPPRDLSSAQEALHWRDELWPSLRAGTSDVASPTHTAMRGRCVLLVVDASASMWAVTVGAAKLREAGAAEVLPFVVHRPAG